MSTNTTPFPPHLVDELLSQLPLLARKHILFGWGAHFASQGDDSIAEVISTISTLDFRYSLTTAADQFSSLQHLPLHNLTSLLFSDSNIGTNHAVLSFIGSSTIFQTLTELDLGRIGLKSSRKLFSGLGSNPFPRLQKLSLAENSDLDLSALATVALPSLEVLDISKIGLSGEMMETILANSDLCKWQLKHFNFSCNPLGDQAVGSFLRSNLLSSDLDGLNLIAVDISSKTLDVIIEIGEDRKWNQLQSLKLICNPLLEGASAVDSLKRLAQSPILGKIVEFELDATSVHESLKYLATSQHLVQNLKDLKLFFSVSLSKDQKLKPFLTNLPSHLRLKSLDLSGSALSLLDYELLWESPILSQLEVLDLSSVSIADLVGDETDEEDNDEDDDANEDDDDANEDDEGDCENNNMDEGDENDEDDDEESAPAYSDLVLRHLAESPTFSRLKLLHLSFDRDQPPCNQETIKQLFTSPMMSNQLVDLELSRCQVGDNNLKLLTTQRVNDNDPTSPLKFQHLEKLSLIRCGLETKAIGYVQQLHNLTHLNLFLNELGENALFTLLGGDDALNTGADGADEIEPSLSVTHALPKLVSLDLGMSQIGPKGGLQLAQSQFLDQLHHINLYGNILGDECVKAMLSTALVSNLNYMGLLSCGSDLPYTRSEAKEQGLCHHNTSPIIVARSFPVAPM